MEPPMKRTFVVEQKPLMNILSSMQPICTKRTTVNATTHILFSIGNKELILKSTDLEISLQCNYLMPKSDIGELRAFLVSGKRIFDIVKELDNDIEFVLEDAQLILKSAGVTVALNIKDEQEFPPFPERIENLMHLDAQRFLHMVNKVAFLIPQNNANPALNGLLMEIGPSGLTMTTTDGHCLAQVTSSSYTLEQSRTWLVPRRAIFEVKKLAEGLQEGATIFLGVCGNQLVFSGESFNFFTKLLVDQFPHYATILKKDGFKAAQVDRAQLVKTLRRSVCLLSGQFIATQFGFTQEQLQVTMQNSEVGKLHESIPLAQFDSQVDIRFYAPYLLGGLQAFTDDALTFYLHSASKPIIFEAADHDHQMMYLVMPVSPSVTQ